MAYTKLHQSILTSTVWLEPHATRIVWISLLALADRHGEVSGTVPGIASIARVTLDECKVAIATFLGPDPYSRSPDDEGRRLETIAGGWQILNYDKYRLEASKDDQKAKTAERTRRWRERQAKANVTQKASQNVASDGHVTHDRDIAEAEAEAEAEKKESKKGAADAPGAPSDDGISAAFNSFVAAARRHPKWPVPNDLTDARRKSLKARLREAGGVGGFLAVLAKAEASRFIREDMTSWSLDWFLKPTNFAKVSENNYADRDKKPAKEPMQI